MWEGGCVLEPLGEHPVPASSSCFSGATHAPGLPALCSVFKARGAQPQSRRPPTCPRPHVSSSDSPASLLPSGGPWCLQWPHANVPGTAPSGDPNPITPAEPLRHRPHSVPRDEEGGIPGGHCSVSLPPPHAPGDPSFCPPPKSTVGTAPGAWWRVQREQSLTESFSHQDFSGRTTVACLWRAHVPFTVFGFYPDSSMAHFHLTFTFLGGGA